MYGSDRVSSNDRLAYRAEEGEPYDDSPPTEPRARASDDSRGPWPVAVDRPPPHSERPEPREEARDDVNHPAHYTSHPSGVECIVVAEHMTFCAGNAIKYLWRAGLKGNGAKHIEDLKKARWYVDREIARLEGTL